MPSQQPPQDAFKNANLVPLATSRLQEAELQPTEPATSKWKYTHEQFGNMIEKKLTPIAKLKGEHWPFHCDIAA